jgi:hypothetical protein
LGSWREVSKSLPGLAFLGIVSIGDLVKSIIGDREFVIEQLEHYIRGAKT